jgi:soluble lytic murein transglycosylase-like protein
VFQRRNFIAGACAVALGLGAATQAAGAPGAAPGEHQARSEAKVPVLDRSRERFKRSVDVYRQERRRHHRERERADSSGAGFASPEQFGVSQATLDAIGSCESGGNPAAVSSDGTYRGKYQFDYGTWESAGGSGDPAAAPEAEQDMRAAMLYSRAGTSPWPICG